MYKTITSSIPAGQFNTPLVDIPGKLVGVVFQLPDTAASSRLRISSPFGVALVINDQNAIVGIGATPSSPIYQMLPNMPVGNNQYQFGLTAVQSGVTPVAFFYEDSPGMY